MTKGRESGGEGEREEEEKERESAQGREENETVKLEEVIGSAETT